MCSLPSLCFASCSTSSVPTGVLSSLWLLRFDHRVVVPRALEPCGGGSGCPSSQSRSAQTVPFTSSSPEPPHAASSCMETVQRFAYHSGLSRGVARQLSLCRHSSSCRLSSIGGRAIAAGALFAAIRSPILLSLKSRISFCFAYGVASVCCYYLWILLDPFLDFPLHLLDLQDDFIHRGLIRSFVLERPLRPVSPPAWDLVLVLSFLRGPAFESLSSRPLRVVMMRVLFLLSLATVK